MVTSRSATSVAPTYQPPEYSVTDSLSSMTLKNAKETSKVSKPGKPSVIAIKIKPGDIVIGVMGITGSGKSTFISQFCDGVVIGHELVSCTSEVGIYECDYDEKTKVYFVDTPGFDDTNLSDADVLRMIADWLGQAHGYGIKLSGIIYLHRITDIRMGHTAVKNLTLFKKLCGEAALKSVVLATTCWPLTSDQKVLDREQDLINNFWPPMIKRGSKVFRQDDDVRSARKIVDYILDLNEQVTLQIQKELETNPLDQTSAGMEVDSQLVAQKKMFEKKLHDIQEELKQAMADKDHEYQKELADFRKETEQKMRKAEADRLALQKDSDELREEMAAQIKEERRKLKEEIEASTRRRMQSEHEMKVMQMEHANKIARTELEIKLEREAAAVRRLEAELEEEKKRGDCAVM